MRQVRKVKLDVMMVMERWAVVRKVLENFVQVER